MSATPQSYPGKKGQRDLWVLDRRGERNTLDPHRPYGYFLEEEMDSSGQLARTAVILLTNQECPWRCVMCDLWRNTLTESVPAGAITEQVAFAMARLGPADVVKLYNSGSFFDSRAIPTEDYPGIVSELRSVHHVIVESHPAFVGELTLRFRDLLHCTVEVALGLETAHPEVLQKLNKGMTLEQFATAASFLTKSNIALRAFIMVRPPFTTESDAADWAKRSIDFAFDCGAGAVSLIPARAGNGAMEALQRDGNFEPPLLTTVERALEYGLALKRGRVFVDLWDSSSMRRCAVCGDLRLRRLRSMNRSQVLPDSIECEDCLSAAQAF